jgi:hypothetical protein
LDPMGKMIQNASSLKPLGQLKPNFSGWFIWWASTNLVFFCWLEISSHRFMGDPVGNQSLEGPLQTMLFMLIGIPRWLPLQDIVFT